MRKNIVKLILLIMLLCLSACGEKEKIEEVAPIEDAEAFVADLYGNDEKNTSDKKDTDNDNEKNTEKSTEKDTEENDFKYDFEGSDSENINTSGYEYIGSVLYKTDGYMYFTEQYFTKVYLSSDYSEAVGIFSYTVPSYTENVKDEFYDYVYGIIEESYGNITKKGSFVNENGHEFEMFDYNAEEGYYGIVYLSIEGDTAAAVIGSSTYPTMSDDFKKVLNSVIIQ